MDTYDILLRGIPFMGMFTYCYCKYAIKKVEKIYNNFKLRNLISEKYKVEYELSDEESEMLEVLMQLNRYTDEQKFIRHMLFKKEGL